MLQLFEHSINPLEVLRACNKRMRYGTLRVVRTAARLFINTISRLNGFGPRHHWQSEIPYFNVVALTEHNQSSWYRGTRSVASGTPAYNDTRRKRGENDEHNHAVPYLMTPGHMHVMMGKTQCGIRVANHVIPVVSTTVSRLSALRRRAAHIKVNKTNCSPRYSRTGCDLLRSYADHEDAVVFISFSRWQIFI